MRMTVHIALVTLVTMIMILAAVWLCVTEAAVSVDVQIMLSVFGLMLSSCQLTVCFRLFRVLPLELDSPEPSTMKSYRIATKFDMQHP